MPRAFLLPRGLPRRITPISIAWDKRATKGADKGSQGGFGLLQT